MSRRPRPCVTLRIRIRAADADAAHRSSQCDGIGSLSINIGNVDLHVVATHGSDECNGGDRRVVPNAIRNNIPLAN